MERRNFIAGLIAAIAAVFLPKPKPAPSWIPFFAQDDWRAEWEACDFVYGPGDVVLDVRNIVIGQYADYYPAPENLEDERG